MEEMNIREFAHDHFIDTGLNRYDVFVRCLAIDEYYGKNNYGFNLYNKMQKLRVGTSEGYEGRFKKLIENVEKKGFNPEYPISIGSGILCDGSHRTSCILSFDIDNVPYEKVERKKVSYNKTWFDMKFTAKEVQLIEAKRLEIFDKFNFFTTIMLWNSVEPYFDAIEKDIAKSHKILESRDVPINTNFIREIYKCDDIATWKVEKKIEHMKGRGNTIRLLRIDMPDPSWRIKEATGKPLSRTGETLKLKYRKQYTPKVPNYFHDIIIHTSDNFEQAEFIRNAINEMYPES
jgi:hypothetical protein